MATGHTVAQPGLQSGSWDPETDLMKQYVVERNDGHGWVALLSFHTREVSGQVRDARSMNDYTEGVRWRVWDQFKNETI